MLGTRTLARGLVAASALALAAGCGSAISTTSPRSVRDVHAANVQGPYVPAGTMVTVRMESELDTMRSSSGQPFVAVVATPLHSPDGTVVVPAGARLQGQLASRGRVDAPRLRLDLQQVETTRGPAAIEARIERTQRDQYAGPTMYVPAAPRGGWGYPYGGWGGGWYGGWYGPIGGGPMYEPFTPTQLRIPRGATMQLQLTRPIIPPGTRVAP